MICINVHLKSATRIVKISFYEVELFCKKKNEKNIYANKKDWTTCIFFRLELIVTHFLRGWGCGHNAWNRQTHAWLNLDCAKTVIYITWNCGCNISCHFLSDVRCRCRCMFDMKSRLFGSVCYKIQQCLSFLSRSIYECINSNTPKKDLVYTPEHHQKL